MSTSRQYGKLFPKLFHCPLRVLNVNKPHSFVLRFYPVMSSRWSQLYVMKVSGQRRHKTFYGQGPCRMSFYIFKILMLVLVFAQCPVQAVNHHN